MYDVERVRRDFPILRRQIHGLPLTYLDNAATTQKPRAVIDALSTFYEHSNANVHRGVHTLGEEATEAYEGTRAHVARFLGAGRPEEIVFTRGTTEAINLVAAAWGRHQLQPGDEIVVSELEHHSNIIPWQLAATATGARLRWIPMAPNGSLDMVAASELIGPRTRLVALTQMSNVLGTITPIAELSALAHAQGALMLVDGAQSAAHLGVDVKELDCDFFAMSAHKLLGPTGVGVLYSRWELLNQMEPYQGGGSMIDTVTMEGATWAEPPAKFEAGTPDIAGVAAFDAALTYLDRLGMDAVRAHDRELTTHAVERLRTLPGVRCFGSMDIAQRGGNISFEVEGIHPHDLGTFLDQQGIAIRAGHHCAQPLMRCLGAVATARASFSVYTTQEEVDRLIAGIHDAQAYFGTVESGAAALRR
ncbi:MAG TPA: cysteine desulfurase [Dehalococcoidia bacterium]|nr:cysteine desulfurase [Dehalococcoidia bacterium]